MGRVGRFHSITRLEAREGWLVYLLARMGRAGRVTDLLVRLGVVCFVY